MTPYYDDGQARLYAGDVRDVLRALPEGAVQMCVTSPPYWGLRDYGTAQWEGGDVECGHTKDRSGGVASSGLEGGKATTNHQHEASFRETCGKCGAKRIDRQLGLEPTPEEYVANMVEVFREVRRVLRDDGTLWLNVGDSYTSGGRDTRDPGQSKIRPAFEEWEKGKRPGTPAGCKPKDLVGIPWMLAFALRADGWYLRQDIIWSKPNPMPESVTDRCTKAHEMLFLLSKSPRYYYNADAIREPAAWERWGDQTVVKEQQGTAKWIGNNATDALREKSRKNRTVRPGVDTNGGSQGAGYIEYSAESRNKRSVWHIPTQPFPEAHFATFPEDLVKPCVLAGCPEGGVVLDPFIGSGTTAKVAKQLGRYSIGIDLNTEYLEMAKRRIAQMGLLI